MYIPNSEESTRPAVLESGNGLITDTNLDSIGAVESVKAASDIYAPVSGVIESINETLADRPNLLNKAPQGDGTLFCPFSSLHHLHPRPLPFPYPYPLWIVGPCENSPLYI